MGRIQPDRSLQTGGHKLQGMLVGWISSEMIKSHQIPDSYVFKSIVGISEGQKRISPLTGF